MKMWHNAKKRKVCQDADELDEPEGHVGVVGNRIFFYSPVTTTALFKFSLHFTELQNDLQKTTCASQVPALRIYIHLHSGGGDVYAGLAIMDIISNCPIPTEIVVEGQCASAATLILLGGTYKKMTSNSMMLIHQLSSSFWGTAEMWGDESRNMLALTEKLKGIYSQRTKIKKRDLDGILRNDIYWHAPQCLSMGLVDEVVATTTYRRRGRPSEYKKN